MISYIRNKINTLTSLVNPSEVENPPQRKVLVIQCHPIKESFSTAILNNVVEGLKGAGHDIRVRRLYFHGNADECYDGKTFQPILTAEDFSKISSTEQIEKRLTGEGFDKATTPAIQDLHWCNSIVFIYPTWSMSVPAMLKGYLDRVLLSGVSFTFKNNRIQPALTNINKVGVVTTLEMPNYAALYVGDNGRRYFSKGFRNFCAPDTTILWHGMYEISSSKLKDREIFLENVKKAYSKF